MTRPDDLEWRIDSLIDAIAEAAEGRGFDANIVATYTTLTIEVVLSEASGEVFNADSRYP